MSQISDIIQLVEAAIKAGLARFEVQLPQAERNLPLVRFILSSDASVSQPQYIGEVKHGRDSEPEVLTVARRLAAGNLNLEHIRDLVAPQVYEILQMVDQIQFRLPGEPKDEFELRFDKLAHASYAKEVQIFSMDRCAPDSDAVSRAQRGDIEAVLALDEKGFYQHVTAVTVPDTFCTQSTLQAVAQNHEVQSGDVLRMMGKSYVSDAGYFKKVNGFFGLNKPEGPRRNPLQEMSLADLFK